MLGSMFELTLTHIRRYHRFDAPTNHMHQCRSGKDNRGLNAKQCCSAYVGCLVGVSATCVAPVAVITVDNVYQYER